MNTDIIKPSSINWIGKKGGKREKTRKTNGSRAFASVIYSRLMPEPSEVVVQAGLDHVVDVRDLPLQLTLLADIALEGQVVHLWPKEK